MFATLPESRRRRGRQYRYTIVSISAHLGFAWAALALARSASAHDAAADPGPPEITYITVEPERDEPARAAPPSRPGRTVPGPTQHVIPDVIIPDVPLPNVDWQLHAARPASASPDAGDRAASGPQFGVSIAGDVPSGSRAFTAAEVDRPVVLRSRGEPRYPAVLRAAGIEGRVVARFVVDTAGRVEPASIEVRASSHAGFAEAVHDVLRRARFQPASVGGRRARQLVELPFIFSLAR